jgi:dienelactone hydrolase
MSEPFTFQTASPFLLSDVGRSSCRTHDGMGVLFRPSGRLEEKRPAVVLLEGLGGIYPEREIAYARQLVEWGYAALVVDSFTPRGMGRIHDNIRALFVTETMKLADLFGATRALASTPGIDPSRIAVMGFSYGGMTSLLAVYSYVQEVFAINGSSPCAHICLYGSAPAKMQRGRTSGAPVMIMAGERDRNVCTKTLAEAVRELREGGSPAQLHVYDAAYHQWDVKRAKPEHVYLSIRGMRFEMDDEGKVRDMRTGIEVRGPVSRALAIGANIGIAGYRMAYAPDIKARSDADLRQFLAQSFATRERAA